MIAAAWVVFLKELRDALRDRRTLTMVLLSSVAIGPLVLVAISQLVAGIEKRAEAREVYAVGIEHAPGLQNFLERQTYTLKAAPPDWEQRLRDSKLGYPVVVVPADYAEAAARGEAPVVELVSSATDQRAQGGSGAVLRLLRAYNQEQAALRLAMRGVAPSALETLRVEERDLADPASRAAQLAFMVPFFVLMAVLYGALNAALDTTAGERERGSLEPLLMNPASRMALVLGKWGAVATVGMLIAVLSCLSFLPAQLLLRSEALSAMFRFGPGEAAWFIALLLPLAGALGGAADGHRHPLQDFQGSPGQRHRAGAGHLDAAAGAGVEPGGQFALAPVGAGAGTDHADGPRAEGRGAADGRPAATRAGVRGAGAGGGAVCVAGVAQRGAEMRRYHPRQPAPCAEPAPPGRCKSPLGG